jgi:uncharacterized membrane protein YedE/YeeE
MSNLVMLVVGIIFGFGLALSGMTHTEKVLNFLDVAGAWDASLMFVLGGAVTLALLLFRLIGRRHKPVFAYEFRVSSAKQIDAPLIVGSALFGIGWGISGYCPGPAIALLAAPNWELWVFVPAMLLGLVAQRYVMRRYFSDALDTEDTSVCG